MYLFIHYFTVQYFERIKMNAFVKGKDGIANGRIVSQAEVLLRRARGRGRMTVPVGEDLQTVLTSILQCRKLILRREGEMFWRVVDVLHPVVLRHHITLVRGNAQQVTARLIRCVLPGLADQFINDFIRNFPRLVVFKVASGLFVIYQVIDGGIRATDGAGVTMLHGNGAELHGLGIEGEQTVGQQLPYPCKVFQCLGCLDGSQHTCDGT